MKKKVPSVASNIFYKNLKKITYCLLFLAPVLSFAQYEIDLFLQFNGKYDFTAIGNTLNPAPNPCNILTESSAELTLDPSQSIVSAHMYWAGSGSIDFGAEYPSDRIVFLNGNEVRSTRQFQATANFGGGGNGRDYFSYYADVTDHVTGDGLYTLSGFDITGNIQGSPDGPYCNSTTDFGGWSIIIIYEDPNLALNQISLFDGYELVYGDPCCNNIEIILAGIDVATDELAKIGFLAWEGDEQIANNETLRINGVPISNAQNPLDNAFNGSNSYTGSNDLFNMDLDVYDLEGIVQPDDTEVQINLTSDQDLIIINNLIISVNSELPDATIEFEPVVAICDDGELEINYTVFNVNSTKFLPAGVNIAFYAETTTETILLDTAITNTLLAIGESESGSINLTIPISDPGFPDIFTLKAVVDDDGTGIGNVSETNEGNNFFEQEIDLSLVTVNLGEDVLIDEGNAICEGLDVEIGIEPGSLGESGYQWYFINSVFVEEEIPGATDSFLTITETGRYILKTTVYVGTSTECIISGDILVEFIPFSPAIEPDPIAICDDPFDDFGEFDLTIRNDQIRGTQSATETTITYYTLEADADAGNANFIDPPNAFNSSTTTVYARLFANVGDCFSVVPLELEVRRPIAIETNILPYELCDNDQSGDEIFNLNTWGEDEILNGLTNVTLTYYENITDAEVPRNEINPANAYISGNTEIWVRAESPDGCTAFNSFNLVLGEVPVYTPVPLFQVCDDAVADGFTDFDLDSKNTEIATFGGVFNPDLTVTYHLTLPDAEAGTIPSLSSPYLNIVNPEFIWVRVEDDITGCYGAFEMELNVISPIAGTPTPLVVCDEVPNNGSADFDLLDPILLGEIINGQTDVDVTFHLFLSEAEAGTPELPNIYNGTTQTIFARLQSTILGFEDCYDVVALDLTVNAAPVTDFVPAEYPLCDNDQDPAGIENFDFDGFITIPTGITLTYYNSEPEAIADRNPITTTTTPASNDYPSAGETIWVRAVNLDGCVTVSSFDLIIDTVPIYTEVPLFQVCDDDGTPDGFTEFDLHSQNIVIATVGGIFNPDLTVTYHLQQTDAEAGTIPSLSSPYTNIVSPEIIWVRVEDDITGCYGDFQMELLVNPLPTPLEPTPFVDCDIDNDGFIIFDLTSKDAEILDGQTGVVITYHETIGAAEAGTPVIIGAYTNTSGPTQTIFARAEFINTGCFDIVPMDLVVNPTPIIPTSITPIGICDINLDSIEDFDLTERADEIYGTQSELDYTLTYYETPGAADSGTGEITTPNAYQNTSDPQTIWVRLEDNITGCYSVGSFIIDFIFCALPDATIVIDNIGVLCSDSNLDITYTVFNNTVTGGILPANTPIAFYADGVLIGTESTNSAIPVNGNEVATTSLFIPVGTPFIFTLKGVVDDDGSGLGIVGEENETNNEFDILVNLDGETINLGPDIESCIGYTVTLDADLGEPGFNYQWFLDGNLIPGATNPLLDVTGNGFYRIEAVNGACFVFGELNVNFNAPPVATLPTPLFSCDEEPNDGIAEFTLTDADAEIINGIPNTFVTYYETLAFADLGDPANALASPFTNTNPNTQIIFARLEDIPVGCFDVVELELNVNGAPTITNPISDYFICDNDNDSTETFNLTTKYDEIVNTLTGITLTYFNTEPDANLGDPADEIPTPTAYISAGGETIWVRATDLAGCVTIGSFDLVAGIIPTFVEVPLLQFCDDATLDGFITFDLDAQTPIIDNGDPNLIVTYHPTQAEAEASTNPILVNPYTNIINPEFIGVRVEDGTTGCFATFEMELNVISIIAGTPGTPTELIECDEEPNDGVVEFTLTDADAIITNGQTGTVVTYHFTEDQAENGTNELPILFTNTTPDTQIIFARLEEGILGCYDVIALELIVKQAPTITNPISDYRLCDNDEDGTEDFDLTSKYDEIVNTLTDITLTYYNTEPDADLGDPINEITTPAAYPSIGSESIWVRAVNLDGCVTVGVFDLVIDTVPIFTEVPLLESCDFGITDGFTEFDLDSQIPTIVAGDLDLNVTYHISQTDAEDDFDPISSPYTNVSNPETIFVRVESSITGCYGTFEMILEVNSPSITTPDDLEYCDPDSDGFGVFTLTDADSQVTGGIPTGNLQVTYHYLIEDAQNGTNPLISPYANDVPFLQTVHVRLYDQTTQCYSITTLDLIVLTTPLIEQPNDLEVCDDDADGVAIFDLTVSEPEILNLIDPADWPNFTIAYFEDPALTIEIGNPAVYFSIPPSPQTIYIVVEDLINGCLSQTTTLQLLVYPPPELIAPLPYALCDVTEITGPDDEQEPFDLESKTDELTGGNPNISITYYETQAQADTGDPLDALTSPYINIENPQTIFVRAEESNNLCTFSTGTTLDLVVNPLPSPETPTPLEVCDDNNDGLAEFILTDKDDEIIAGEPGVAITYHELVTDAETGVNPLTSPYTNTTTYSQIVYARVEFPIALGGTGCFTIVELELVAIPTPVIPVAIPDLVACDDDGDGLTEFDLTLQQDIIFGDQDPIDYTLTYHTTEPDAQDGTNPIATPEAFLNTTNPQTIWVRLQDNANTCIKIGSFELVVELAPVFTLVPVVELCDDLVQDGFTEFDLNLQNNIITGGDPTLSVTYYPTELDAEDATNPLSLPHTNVVNPETIFVRVQSGVTGCYATFPMELIVVEAPTIVTPNPLEVCDPDNDGFSEFILTDADLEVTGGIPTGNLVVTYHYLLEDAINNVLPLASPYENEVPFLQTIFVRLVDQTTGCFNTTTLDLIVKDSPQIVAPDPIVACDDDSDGIEVFDLTQSEPQILENAGTGAYTVNYYEDAALTLEIVNPTAYSNISNPQTIFIVVEDQEPTNLCTSETTLLLEVVDAPTLVPPTELEMCDMTEIDGAGDELEPFDLESKTDEITGGDLTIEVTYYETQADADAGTNALVSPYINIENPQTIFIRADDLNTGCIVSQGITLSLVVNPLPSPVTPTPLESCDVSNDGFTFFTLTDKDDEIIAGEPGVTVSYYETLFDAEQAVDPLISPYTNIVTPSQIVYARAEFPVALGGTGCFKIVELELIVIPTPVIPIEMEDLVVCDDDGDGFAEFDLTLQETIIFGDDQDPDDYTLTYYLLETDAQDDVNPIANPESFENTTNPQTIWVRLQDNVTECPKIGSFDIRVEIGPEIFEPTPLTQCDDLGEPNDEVTLFDLTAKNEEITGGASGLTVQYYETQADAEADVNEIDPDTAYQNTSNPQIVWVRVTDVNTLCVDTTVSLTIRVAANPEPEQPDPIVLCDVTNPGDQQEVFDLTIRQAQILDGETWTLSYHNSFEDAVDNNAPIATPTAYTNISTPEIVYVRVSIDPTDPQACFEIVELELIVNPIPDGSAVVTPYIICEIPSDDEAIFDLTTKNGEILNGQDPVLFEVLFYESQADADAMLNPIQEPETYTNLTNPQTIFVVILNTDTDCFVATQSFDIEEREGAVANTPLEPYAICDYYNANDGIAEFDLLNQELLDEILGGQNPLGYQLDFYGTLENAELEIAPLPINYVNVINPQIIYARVTNITSDCYDITEVILKVELIPEVVLEPSYRLCVDAAGAPIQEEEGSASPPVIDTQLDPSVYMFEWQLNGDVLLGEIGASITALQEGNYSVTVTEILTGCMAATDTQVVISSPPLNYDVQVTEAFASQHNITATAEGIGEYIFQLDDNPFQDSGYFLNVVPGTHTITIKDIYGCGSVTTEVAVIDFPRFITPNQDGYHDTWNILGISIGDPTAKIYIFDRFGKLLKQISPMSPGWDGTYNGNPLPSNDYWFRIEYTENNIKKEFSGHFSLKR